MIKRDNRFEISLDFGYVLHHFNGKETLIYSPDVTECVLIRGDSI